MSMFDSLIVLFVWFEAHSPIALSFSVGSFNFWGCQFSLKKSNQKGKDLFMEKLHCGMKAFDDAYLFDRVAFNYCFREKQSWE